MSHFDERYPEEDMKGIQITPGGNLQNSSTPNWIVEVKVWELAVILEFFWKYVKYPSSSFDDESVLNGED